MEESKELVTARQTGRGVGILIGVLLRHPEEKGLIFIANLLGRMARERSMDLLEVYGALLDELSRAHIPFEILYQCDFLPGKPILLKVEESQLPEGTLFFRLRKEPGKVLIGGNRSGILLVEAMVQKVRELAKRRLVEEQKLSEDRSIASAVSEESDNTKN